MFRIFVHRYIIINIIIAIITLADVLAIFEETPSGPLVLFPFNGLIMSMVSRVFVQGI